MHPQFRRRSIPSYGRGPQLVLGGKTDCHVVASMEPIVL
jgi:hypothetical protein